jgi:hypothetical protein
MGEKRGPMLSSLLVKREIKVIKVIPEKMDLTARML